MGIMSKRIVSFFLLFILSTTTFARWATHDDAELEFLERNQTITIHADGKAEVTNLIKIKILNEQGREELTTLPLQYNSDNTKLSIVLAKITVDGVDHLLGPDLIEDKPLASAAEGFDQMHQVLLAFPQTKIGAIIELQIKQDYFNPTIPGLFETIVDFGSKDLQDANVVIRSEIPVYIKLNDPQHAFKVKEFKEKKQFGYNITLSKPLYMGIVNETSLVPSFTQLPWLYVSTAKNWDKVAKVLAADYNSVIQQPLPPLYENILLAAHKETDPLKQIDIVTSKLNESIKYMGDWRSNKGKMFPQDLAKAAARRLGDCKDFATGTAAILNRLGIKSSVAVVFRGRGMYDISALTLPGLNHFNHAMVKAQVGNTTYWVDPTNSFSIANKILPDIADREVLVLDALKPELERIPRIQPQDALLKITRELDFTNPELVSVTGTMSMQGITATKFTGYELYNSKETLDSKLLGRLGNFDNMLDKKIVTPNLKSRIVENLDFTFSYKEKNKILNTNAGLALLIGNPVNGSYVFSDERVGGVSTDGVSTLELITILKNIKAQNNHDLNCDIKSPWVDAKRTVTYKDNSVTVLQQFAIKQSQLSNDVIKSAAYKKVAQDLETNFNDGVAIVFSVSK